MLLSTPIPTNTNVPPTETLTPVPPTDTPTTTPVPPTVTPEWMAPPFDEICGLNSNLTEIQQNAKVKAMLGKKLVGWIGKVYDVKRDGDKYTISVDMTSGLFRTRNLVITGITDASVAGLNVDQQISFDATIQDIDIVFGVVCNPMTVTDAKITPQ